MVIDADKVKHGDECVVLDILKILESYMSN